MTERNSKSISTQFKSEFQASINISGRGGKGSSGGLISIIALYGGRYYLNDPKRPTSVFTKALFGGVFISETGSNFVEYVFGIGYSAGFYLTSNRFVVGVSAENFNNLILNKGYTF